MSSNPRASPEGASGALAFARCIRSSGVPNFPDPGGALPPAVDPNAASNQTAQRACQSLLPSGTGGGPSAADQENALEFAACVRSHGFPDFPDPDLSRGIHQLIPDGIDPTSPRFLAARGGCASWQTHGQGGAHVGPNGGGSP